jgi:hypothetical protein
MGIRPSTPGLFFCIFGAICGLAGGLVSGAPALSLPTSANEPTAATSSTPAGSVTEVQERRSKLFEISPNVGFMGGSAFIGARASMGTPVSCEFAIDQVIGRTATLYPITVNAKLDLTNRGKTIPYGIVGGGLFLTVPLNSVGDRTISSVGLCFGGGIKYYLNSKIGIRFETKQLFTRIDNQRDHRKELLIFQSTGLGVIFAFG